MFTMHSSGMRVYFGDFSVKMGAIEHTFIRRIEREWWKERKNEFNEACDRGKIGDMYKCLRKIVARGIKAAESCMISTNDFKSHFESVSRERYEEDPSVIESVIERVVDLRMEGRALVANGGMNDMHESEEIMKAMKETRESTPGEDDVRLSYIMNACDEVRERVIEFVSMIFDIRAIEWAVSSKSGITVLILQKGDRKCRNSYRGVCLLSMCSRILARVIAKKLSWWAE